MIRRVIGLTQNDAHRLVLYTEAMDMIRDLPDGSYPDEEAAWLISSCFNHGCFFAKSAEYATAQTHMRVALGLLQFCPSLQSQAEVPPLT